MKAFKGAMIALAISAVMWLMIGLYFASLAGATPAQDQAARLTCDRINAEAVNFHDAHGGAYITDQGITNVLMVMFHAGMSPETAGDITTLAVTKFCPEWQQAFVEYFQELDAGVFTINDDGTVIYTKRQYA